MWFSYKNNGPPYMAFNMVIMKHLNVHKQKGLKQSALEMRCWSPLLGSQYLE